MSRSASWWVGPLVGAVCLVGVTRIVSTYPVFSNTFDEPAHIAGGIDWWEHGTVPRHTVHTPLARAVVAAGPYLAGVRSVQAEGLEKERGTLYQGGRYRRNLTLARAGTLIFFLLAAAVVWRWGHEVYGKTAGLFAVLLFTSLPAVLAHSGLATTDMAFTATLGGAFYFFDRWTRGPGPAQSLLLGLSLGLACLSKIATVLFFPAGVVGILVVRTWFRAQGRPLVGSRWGGALLAGVVFFLVVWAGYRFSVGSLATPDLRPHDPVDRVLGTRGKLHDVAYTVVEGRWVPAAQFFRTLNEVRALSERGRATYILGRRLEGDGVWYFFPVALGVKSPLGWLVLVWIGIVVLWRRARGNREGSLLAPVAAAAGILLVLLPSDVNLGVRHVLPVVLLLSLPAGIAVTELWNRAGGWRVAGALLVVWVLGSSALAHPDYLAYFNELAAGNPEGVLVDSDLDWGQDLDRLSRFLDQTGIEDLALAYYGTADPARAGLPRFRGLDPEERSTGWIAVSRTLLKLGPGLAWLDRRTPAYLVGRSIEIHRVESVED